MCASPTSDFGHPKMKWNKGLIIWGRTEALYMCQIYDTFSSFFLFTWQTNSPMREEGEENEFKFYQSQWETRQKCGYIIYWFKPNGNYHFICVPLKKMKWKYTSL